MQQESSSEAVENLLEYDGETKFLFKVWFVYLFLSIITAGIYSFWGKTKMRKYIGNSFRLLQDRFEYNGTGGELFRGFLKVLPIIIPIYLPLFIWGLDENPQGSLMFLPLISLVLWYLYFVAIYGALKYRLSRTTWRGIRGRLAGSAFRFGLQGVIRMFLNFITCGLLIPSSYLKIYKFIAGNTYFGNAGVHFDATAKPLFGVNLITLLLSIPTVGLARFWYLAARMRYSYAHTTINNLRFKATHTGASLLGLSVGNMLIMIFSLRIGSPIVIQRKCKYFSEHVFIVGDINTSGILQSDENLGSSGEGLGEVFGLDFGLSLNFGLI